MEDAASRWRGRGDGGGRRRWRTGRRRGSVGGRRRDLRMQDGREDGVGLFFERVGLGWDDAFGRGAWTGVVHEMIRCPHVARVAGWHEAIAIVCGSTVEW